MASFSAVRNGWFPVVTSDLLPCCQKWLGFLLSEIADFPAINFADSLQLGYKWLVFLPSELTGSSKYLQSKINDFHANKKGCRRLNIPALHIFFIHL